MGRNPRLLELSTEVAELILTRLMLFAASYVVASRTCKSSFGHAKVQRG
jgi:hypothetical protein